MSSFSRGMTLGIGIGAVVASVATAGVFRWTASDPPLHEDRAEMVHDMGGGVMPFAMDKTTHIFQMTDSGGIQDVVAKEATDTATTRLVRQHLMHEARRFGQGDFTDPMALHGPNMPGVAELSAGAERLQVAYRELPDGGRIVYSTSDPELVTAVHRWFGAQLSDHGADATYR